MAWRPYTATARERDVGMKKASGVHDSAGLNPDLAKLRSQFARQQQRCCQNFSSSMIRTTDTHLVAKDGKEVLFQLLLRRHLGRLHLCCVLPLQSDALALLRLLA